MGIAGDFLGIGPQEVHESAAVREVLQRLSNVHILTGLCLKAVVEHQTYADGQQAEVDRLLYSICRYRDMRNEAVPVAKPPRNPDLPFNYWIWA